MVAFHQVSFKQRIMKKQCFSYLPFFLGSFLCGNCFSDPEHNLARQDQAKRIYEEIILEKGLTPEQLFSRWKYLANVYPETQWPAWSANTFLSSLFASGRYLNFAEGFAKFCKDYPDYGSLKASLLYQLVRIVIDRNLPEDIRKDCLLVFLDNCQHASWMLSLTQNTIASLPLSPEEKYILARRGEEVCGTYPYSRVFLWSFLDCYTSTVPAEKAIPELKRFLDRYQEQTPERWNALKRLLFLQSKSGDENSSQKLKEMEEIEKNTAQKLKEILSSIHQLFGAKQYQDALKILEEIKKQPAGVTEPFWKDFLKEIQGLSSARQIPFLSFALEVMPSGRIAEDYYAHISSFLKGKTESIYLIKKYLEKNAGDIHRDGHKIKQLAQLPFLDTRPGLMVEVMMFCAKMCRRLNLADAASDYFFKAGRGSWCIDKETAIKNLEQAVRFCPTCQAATAAEWFLSVLNGETKIVQGPLPRNSTPEKSFLKTPSCSLPPLPETPETIILAGEEIALANFPASKNLLKDAAFTCSSGNGSLAIDGKRETSWQPENLPAVLMVSLPRVASIEKLVIILEEYTYFTISFLDISGKTISRYERDWNFWEQFRTKSLYPGKEVTLQINPVHGVACIKLELSSSLGLKTGVKELEAYSTAFALEGCLVKEVSLSPGIKGISLNWECEEKEKEIIYTPQMESFRGFPIMRWQTPWLKRKSVLLRQIGGQAGIEFCGDNASLLVSGTGKIRWFLDTGHSGLILHPEKEKSEHLLADNLPSGRHYLWLENEIFPAKQDTYGAGDCEIHGVKVKGKTQLFALVRFGNGKNWTCWLGPVTEPGKVIKIPSATTFPLTVCQAKFILKSDSVRGELSPIVKNIQLLPHSQPGEELPAFKPLKPPLLSEDLETVADAISRREIVIVYPKMGTKEELEIAREIAEKASVYLVSDDIGLNLYPGVVLAIGTPLTHRYCRQLLAAKGIWSDANFLNNKEGVVGWYKNSDASIHWLFVTGETPEAVVAAGRRLLGKIKSPLLSDKPFRLFSSDVLEVVYPWQLHPERRKPEILSLTLGQNDTRSLQLGITANKNIVSLSASCRKLVSDQGDFSGEVKLRAVGFYEWEPFFGDLRLPNFLVDFPISLPGKTSTGIWLTVKTTTFTRPGIYHGEIVVSGQNYQESVPVRVNVLPIQLPSFSRVKTMSFAAVPWFFPPGTEEWKKATKSLAENEARHSVSVVSLPMLLTWECEEGIEPVRQAITSAQTAESENWAVYTAGGKKVPEGSILTVEFASPLKIRQAGLAVRVTSPEDLVVEVCGNQGIWKRLDLLPYPKGTNTEPSWYGLFFTGLSEKVKKMRFFHQKGKELEIGKIVAFSEENREYPFTVDFSLLKEQMQIIEEVYRKENLPPPFFLSQLTHDTGKISGELVGVSHWHNGGCQKMFAEQLAAFVEKTGRLERFILKVSDEPRDIKEWVEWAKPYRLSGLRTMTCHSGNYPEIEVASGIMEPWCPNYQHNVLRPFFQERQKVGEEVWWYCCGVPPTRITGQPVDNLPFYWLTKKWKFDGALNYAALHCNIHIQPVPFRYDHGLDHRIAFLPDGTILDTTRRQLEAEGIQDMKLLEQLEKKIHDLKEKGEKEKASQLNSQLQQILEAVVPYKYGYSQKMDSWNEARSRLYQLILGNKEDR